MFQDEGIQQSGACRYRCEANDRLIFPKLVVWLLCNYKRKRRAAQRGIQHFMPEILKNRGNRKTTKHLGVRQCELTQIASNTGILKRSRGRIDMSWPYSPGMPPYDLVLFPQIKNKLCRQPSLSPKEAVKAFKSYELRLSISYWKRASITGSRT